MAESEASKVFSRIKGDLGEAQHQWNTYAKGLGLAYALAYKEHERTLGHMKRKDDLQKDLAYFLFSGFVVGYAGGVAGAMMAPWVKRAGEMGGNEFLRTIVAETLKEESKRAITLPQKWLEINVPPSSSKFEPVADDPYTSETRMTYEIGICFSRVRDAVNDYMNNADEKKLPASEGEKMLRQFRAKPLIADHPKTDNMPDVAEVQRQAEIGMWIAWANARNLKWWYSSADRATDGNPDYGWGLDQAALSEYDPVLSRLKIQGVAHIVTIHADPVIGFYGGMRKKKQVLNLPILRVLGEVLGGGFHSKVADIVKDSRKALPEMASLPPIYKQALSRNH